jgi:SAM-dependent methyltransferase
MPESNASAAARFYAASHERALRNDRERLTHARSVRDGLDVMAQPGHRYHCAYRHLKQGAPKSVVELGFGRPELVNALASLSERLVILDIVDRCAGLRLPPNACLQLADLDEAFPFPDGQFDTVLAMMIIEHLYDPFHAFAELARILRPGGYAFVNLPNIASIRCRLSLAAGRMPVTSSRDWFEKREWDGNHLHYFTVADVRRLGAQAGLEPVALHAVGKALPFKKAWPQLFCHEISYSFRKAP